MNLHKHMNNHKNEEMQKPYGLIDTYKKFVTVIKAGRVPFAIVIEVTHEYNRKYATVTKETHKHCQNFSNRKTTKKKALSMKY